MANEIWRATGYRFTYVCRSGTIQLFALNETAESKITHNFPTDTRPDIGARKMKHIDPSLREPLGKPRVIFTSRDSQVRGRRTGFHVGVGCLFLREIQAHLVVPLSPYGCIIMTHMNLMST
jgi:hypothetical protein